MEKQNGKKYYCYDPYEQIPEFNHITPYARVAVSEKILPDRVRGPCALQLPRLPLNLKKGTWFVPVMGDPIILTIILNERVQYLGRRKALLPDFIREYAEYDKDKRKKMWLVCKFADGKALYLNWDFISDAKNLQKRLTLST